MTSDSHVRIIDQTDTRIAEQIEKLTGIVISVDKTMATVGQEVKRLNKTTERFQGELVHINERIHRVEIAQAEMNVSALAERQSKTEKDVNKLAEKVRENALHRATTNGRDRVINRIVITFLAVLGSIISGLSVYTYKASAAEVKQEVNNNVDNGSRVQSKVP